jgi:hypothetical protein
VASPSTGKLDNDVAGVIEYDGNEGHRDGGVSLRSPEDNPFLPVIGGYDHSLEYTHGLIVTNHYIKRSSIGSGGTVARYMSLKTGLTAAMEDGNVDPEEARNLLRSVGGTGTLHSVIFEPDNFILRIFFAAPGQGAFESDPHVFTFEELFPLSR